ncbi:hypothetical protein BDW72DRAFT_209316 [Aspergillus terricola var. indicus]
MGNDFVFIHVREPKDALKLAKDSHIRSHVTRRQWKQFEERFQAAFQRDLKKAKMETQGKDHRHGKQHLASGGIVRLSQPARATQPVCFGLPIPRPFGGLRRDPFRSYPVAWRPILPRLVDHSRKRGLLRTDWFPLVMTEPSHFLVIILLAASNYASVQTELTDMKLHLLGLRCEAVQAVNKSLELQPSFIGDALIGAIAKMASYEAMYGNTENYAVHMQGLQRAVELRGGLDALGLGGLLRRIVIWIDRNGAFLNGSTLYFPGETFVPGQQLPDPNPGHFLGAQ